ncbi:MAG: putative lipid II flippase FtsW [Chlamydiota bacterium]|nr:putative lipid II flippase FtsW [Chlamydiota bacterium]
MERISNQILIVVLSLIGVGLVMIYSTSAVLAQARYADEYFFLKRQLIWTSVGIVFLYLCYRIPSDFWNRHARWMLAITIVLLISVHIPYLGRTVGGARRWIVIGAFTFQPSELAKLSLIIYLSSWLSQHQHCVKSFGKGFVPMMLIVGGVVGLIIIQPDLGTCIVLGTISFVLLFVGGVRIFYLISLLLSALPALYYSILNVAYRKARILSFLNPWEDPLGKGFQIIQSFIALGSGGWFGVGLGQSRQKLFYLPEAHTDFIFSILGEELGFIGTLFVCMLYMILVILGYRAATKAKDLFSHLAGIGIVTLIAMQTVINIGVVTGSFPTKGLPLPFVSFGGSSLVMNMMGIGILMGIARSSAQNRVFIKRTLKRKKKKGSRVIAVK